jgi:hypothetical protein
MQIAYRLALRDIVFFQNYHFDHSPSSARTRRLATWGGAAVILALIAVMAVISESWPLLAMGVALAAVYAFGFPVFLRANVRRMTMRLYAGRLNVLGRRELEITEEGVLSRSEEGTGVTPWESIVDVIVLDRYLFVYLGEEAAHIVPRDNVLEGDFVAFAAALRRARAEHPRQDLDLPEPPAL